MVTDQHESPATAPADGNEPASIRSSILTTVESNPKAYSRWTDDENDQLLQLLRSGCGWADIASQLGRTRGAVRTQGQRLAFATVYGRSLPDYGDYERNREPWTDEDLQRLDELARTASSWDQVGNALQRTPSSCSRRAGAEALNQLLGAGDVGE